MAFRYLEQTMASRRYRHDALAATDQPRWLVERDLQHNLIRSQPLPPGADLRAALQGAIRCAEAEGWAAECDGSWGFAFVHRAADRRMLAVLAVDPHAEPVAGAYSPAQAST